MRQQYMRKHFQNCHAFDAVAAKIAGLAFSSVRRVTATSPDLHLECPVRLLSGVTVPLRDTPRSAHLENATTPQYLKFKMTTHSSRSSSVK